VGVDLRGGEGDCRAVIIIVAPQICKGEFEKKSKKSTSAFSFNINELYFSGHLPKNRRKIPFNYSQEAL
jgi:hypothetical protein